MSTWEVWRTTSLPGRPDKRMLEGLTEREAHERVEEMTAFMARMEALGHPAGFTVYVKERVRRIPRFPLWPRVEILNRTDPLAVMIHWLHRHWYYVDGDR